MNILAIETSCDETAIAILEATDTTFTVRGNALYSQASKHAEYGGVYPNLAKREHQHNLAPLTEVALKQAEMLNKGTFTFPKNALDDIRDDAFRSSIQTFLEATDAPDIDLIAVTNGPGLEPALWTGINFAEALGAAWNIPVIGVDHMEGHIFSALLETEKINPELQETNSKTKFKLSPFNFPLLSLLISGGHTELILMHDWFSYELIGKTRDDAVGEAFDKTARLLGLPYPGGPHVAERAAEARTKGTEKTATLPRPMINDSSCDFSFSGIKTAVLYLLRNMGEITDEQKNDVAREFEDAARDVMVAKTRRALETTRAQTFVVGGGVSANTHIREGLTALIADEFPDTALYYPHHSLTGDNAVMIGIAGYLRHQKGAVSTNQGLQASGNQSLVA